MARWVWTAAAGGIVAALLLPVLWVAPARDTAAGNSSTPTDEGQCGCPAGNVSDCCCSFSDLEVTNSQAVHALLTRIAATPFFGHFRVNLCSDCRLWEDHPMCMLRDCGVCECEAPPTWALGDKVEEKDDCGWSPQVSQGVQVLAADAHAASSWADAGSDGFAEEVVVDLRENPERYTGYAGTSAAKVWDEIHNRNCFQESESPGDECVLSAAQRIYNRLVGGLHSSISLHIAHDYCLERSTSTIAECARWGMNVEEARVRVLQHPERVENLYATYAVVLRAVVLAGDAVGAAVPAGDEHFTESLHEWERSLLPELRRVVASCPKTFAEDEVFTGVGSEVAWAELQRRAEHMAEVMRCVGCDRCKLWGTLQTQGLAVALRVLFESSGAAGLGTKPLALSRQEAVALVRLLERLSASLHFLGQFRQV